MARYKNGRKRQTDTLNTQIHDRPLSSLGIGTSIKKNGGVNPYTNLRGHTNNPIPITTVTKRKRQTMDDKTLHRSLKIEQNEPL